MGRTHRVPRWHTHITLEIPLSLFLNLRVTTCFLQLHTMDGDHCADGGITESHAKDKKDDKDKKKIGIILACLLVLAVVVVVIIAVTTQSGNGDLTGKTTSIPKSKVCDELEDCPPFETGAGGEDEAHCGDGGSGLIDFEDEDDSGWCRPCPAA